MSPCRQLRLRGASPCLASHLLACLARQLPHDWHERCRIRPVLLGTFCETPRFAGTCYRAANWVHPGQTRGRGKLDTRHEYAKPVKNIFVKPLCKDWKAILNRQDRSIPRCPLERLRPGCRARTANPLTGKALSGP